MKSDGYNPLESKNESMLCAAGKENAGNWYTELQLPSKRYQQQLPQKPKNYKSNTNMGTQKIYHPASGKALERQVKQATKLNGIFLLWLHISQSLSVISPISKRCPGTTGKDSTNLSANMLSWENFHTKWLYSHNFIKRD